MSEEAADLWRRIAALTPARVALGRVGSGLPTAEVLRFAMAHAKARDAVHASLDIAAVSAGLRGLGFDVLTVASAAPTREVYLLRPDLGRRLAAEGRRQVEAAAGEPPDLAVVVADGLSARAAAAHAVPLLAAFQPYAVREGWRIGPIVVATEARVALGDEVGALLKARMALLLVGERPGLSSPDSLGLYLTYAPRSGRTDAERNCISNIHGAGLDHGMAAFKAAWLVRAALRRQITGVALKDESDTVPIEAAGAALLAAGTAVPAPC